LLLRATAGTAIIIQGTAYLAAWHELRYLGWALILLAMMCGVLLLIGYVTPFAGIVAALYSLSASLLLFPAIGPILLSQITAVFAAVIAVALVCLGPGAFSVDARLFGRREIVIPTSHSTNS
jgi:uncharacterized membrane protein YphA (DoxX/SURF4 family)